PRADRGPVGRSAWEGPAREEGLAGRSRGSGEKQKYAHTRRCGVKHGTLPSGGTRGASISEGSADPKNNRVRHRPAGRAPPGGVFDQPLQRDDDGRRQASAAEENGGCGPRLKRRGAEDPDATDVVPNDRRMPASERRSERHRTETARQRRSRRNARHATP